MKIILFIIGVFVSLSAKSQTYNPSLFTTTNKSLGVGQAVPTDARSQFWDNTNFVARDYASVNEVWSYLNLPKYRSGGFPIYIHNGGVLGGNGVWTGGIRQVYWFKDSTGNANLVRWYTDSTGIAGGPFFSVANNLSEGNAGVIKTNLSLDQVNNTSDATKNSATATLTNKIISGLTNTFSNIPNSALANTSIGLTLNSIGTSPSVTTTPAALGTNLVLSVPNANGTNTGFILNTDWTNHNNKVDSTSIAATLDSVFDWHNGSKTYRYKITGGGGGAVLSVANSDGTIVFSPNTGNVVGSLNLGHANTWTQPQTYGVAPIFSTFSSNGGVFYGNAGGTLQQATAGTTNQILKGGTTPVFFTPGATDVNGWLGYTALSNSLGSTHIFVGNGSNVATDVALSGRGSISNTGVFSLTNSGVTAGSYTNANITVSLDGTISLASSGSGGISDSGIAVTNGILATRSGSAPLRLLQADTGLLATKALAQKKIDSLGAKTFNLYVRRKGQPGDTALTGHDSILAIAAQRDSIDAHHIINADSSWTWYVQAHDSTSANALQTKYRSDTGRNNIYTSLAGKQPTGNYITALTGDVAASGPGSAASTIQPNVVSYSKIQTAAGQGLMGATGAGNFGLITLGTNLSMTGSVLNAAGGGGADSAIWKNNGTYTGNHTLTMVGFSQTFSGGLNKFDSAYLGPIQFEITIGDSIVFIGTSITFGTGPTSNYYRYSTLATRQLSGYGFVEYNLGVSGSTLASQIANIPIKTARKRFLNIEFGSNELLATMDSATFRAGYIAFLDTALARGWSGSQIIITSQMGSQYGVVGTIAQQRGYNYVDSTLAIQFGTAYSDAYNPELLKEYNYVNSVPQLHPNNDQSYVLGSIVAGSIASTFNVNHQRLAVKDTIQIASIIDKNNYYVAKGEILGVDSQGRVGVIKTLHNNFATQGNFIINNNLTQRGAILPNVFDSTKDFVFNPNSKMYKATNGTVYGLFDLYNAAGTSNWTNNFSSGVIQIDAKNIQFGFNTTSPTTGFNGLVNINNQIQEIQAGATNYLNPSVSGTGNFDINNSYINGHYRLLMSDSVNASSVQMQDVDPEGRSIFQEGGTYIPTITARLAINDIEAGFLMPRMNTTQRNAIPVGRITIGSITSGGSAYTTGSYTAISLTGGSGSGAIANITVAGGLVNGVTLTAGGSGYKIGDILSANAASIGGTGSGFQYTITDILDNGLMVINTTNNKINWYDGSFGWRTVGDSAASGSGVTIVGTFSGSSQTNGASISTNTITFGPADATNPGMIKNIGSQILGATLTMPAPLFTSLTSSGANDSVLTSDPSTGQVHRRAATLFANGLTAAGGDSVYLGGTLNQHTRINGNSDSLILGTSSSPIAEILSYSNGYGWWFRGTSSNTQKFTIGSDGGNIQSINLYPGTVTQIGSNFALAGWQTITSGTSATIVNSTTNVLINPASVIASFTLTLPAAPFDGCIIKIFSGGTITGTSAVVTAFTLSPNTSQTIMQKSAPTTLLANDCLILQYNSALSLWYREQ